MFVYVGWCEGELEIDCSNVRELPHALVLFGHAGLATTKLEGELLRSDGSKG